MHHQLFHLPCHGLNVVDDQLIQIGELMRVNDEFRAGPLSGGIRIQLDNI